MVNKLYIPETILKRIPNQFYVFFSTENFIFTKQIV